MRKLLPILFLFVPFMVCAKNGGGTEEALNILDASIRNRDKFADARLRHINYLKQTAEKLNDEDAHLYDINALLYKEYASYQFDSALYYLNSNAAIAERMADRRRMDETHILQTELYARSGYYLEATTALERVDTAAMHPSLRALYYKAALRLSSEIDEYSRQDSAEKSTSADRKAYYAQRLLDNLPAGSDDYIRYLSERHLQHMELSPADSLVGILLRKSPADSHEYAIYAYTKALIEGYKGNADEQVRYFALSAAADIQSATKDNSSLCMLSQLLFYRNDIDRAFRYIRLSMDDALFFNARLRPWQIAGTLPIIEQAYLAKRQAQYNTVVILIIIISVLLISCIILVFRQARQKHLLMTVRDELQQSNHRLNIYNEELSQRNAKVAELNNKLLEANSVKEEYIGLFLSIFSEYIDSMQNYRRTLKRMMSAGNTQGVYKELSSQSMGEEQVKEFYRTFDNAFLNLYPDFVDEFNSLLEDDARIVLDKEESLNTELRIFALIRLGITDSSKIAELLRYSVNTIYNYRAKVKNHSKVSREEFEQRIKQIGSFRN